MTESRNFTYFRNNDWIENLLPISGYGSNNGFWSGGRKLSGEWKWSNGETITTFPAGQPVNDPSHEYAFLDSSAAYSLVSSADRLLYALCEGELSQLISVWRVHIFWLTCSKRLMHWSREKPIATSKEMIHSNVRETCANFADISKSAKISRGSLQITKETHNFSKVWIPTKSNLYLTAAADFTRGKCGYVLPTWKLKDGNCSSEHGFVCEGPGENMHSSEIQSEYNTSA